MLTPLLLCIVYWLPLPFLLQTLKDTVDPNDTVRHLKLLERSSQLEDSFDDDFEKESTPIFNYNPLIHAQRKKQKPKKAEKPKKKKEKQKEVIVIIVKGGRKVNICSFLVIVACIAMMIRQMIELCKCLRIPTFPLYERSIITIIHSLNYDYLYSPLKGLHLHSLMLVLNVIISGKNNLLL